MSNNNNNKVCNDNISYHTGDIALADTETIVCLPAHMHVINQHTHTHTRQRPEISSALHTGCSIQCHCGKNTCTLQTLIYTPHSQSDSYNNYNLHSDKTLITRSVENIQNKEHCCMHC